MVAVGDADAACNTDQITACTAAGKSRDFLLTFVTMSSNLKQMLNKLNYVAKCEDNPSFRRNTV